MIKEYPINKQTNLVYLSKEDIENETEYVLLQYCKECLEKPMQTPIENLIYDLGLNLNFTNLSKDNSCYGAFIFNKGAIDVFDDDGNMIIESYEDKTILIDKKIYEQQKGITFFTLGNELGHYYLQYILRHVDENQMSIYDLMEKDEKAKYFLDTDKELSANLNPKDEIYKFSFLEWQPNYFSSCILMPKKTLDIKLKEEIKDFKKLQFYSTMKNLNEYDYNKVINDIKNVFNVSKPALENRLKSLEYI